ncbi:MAG TPA: S8 family serine peptidase, partial [Chroococcales cyanobacterium]
LIDCNDPAAVAAKLSKETRILSSDSENGILVALSSDPAFVEKTEKIDGVNGVALDHRFQAIPPMVARPLNKTKRVQSVTDELFPAQWGMRQIQVEKAWEYSKGKGVRVAVIDTGVDFNNPDLAPNLDLKAGGNVIDYGPDQAAGIMDLMGHGSHVAGIIAAAENGFGVVGVAPKAVIVPIKAATWDGGGTVGDAIAGIRLALKAKVDIINLSLGFTYDQTNPAERKLAKALKKVIHRAADRGILVVCASGNEATDLGKTPMLPVSVGDNLGVSATGPINQKDFDAFALYSNYGKGVDLAAPGGNVSFDAAGIPTLADINDLVLSTWSNSAVEQTFFGIPLGPAPFMYLIGTSMAAPHVAGTAALVLARFHHLSLSQLKHQLLETADDLGAPGKDPFFGHGRVNAYNAVRSLK